MKLKFKKQDFQTQAVESTIDCFDGQVNTSGIKYQIDPGKVAQTTMSMVGTGFKNEDLMLSETQVLSNIQEVQKRQNLPVSKELSKSKISNINLDIEMETGTGKTYVYIKTMYEMNIKFGWSKFIVVVPSIAIREGVYKSLQITQDHFQQQYSKKTRFFIYNSKQLHNLESFSSDAGINIMVINVQAFNATGKDNRRIYEELDDFQSRRPIDVISANRPILILDEPQKMEGGKTLDSLVAFNPLMILRYSATHKTTHNKVHRLDALDAYNQKLVKKIAVRGISVKGLSGTNAYLYLESIQTSKQAPIARLEIEVKHKKGIKREIRRINHRDNLFDVSNGLDQYNGFVVSDINANTDVISFTNGVEIEAGEATGDVSESTLRRIQIREAIKAHLENEQILFQQNIKVLTLFFIDEVAKYRKYTEAGDVGGEYARVFEEEYLEALNNTGLALHPEYKKYLDGIKTTDTHNGYFAIDKKTNHLIDPKLKARTGDTDDVDAYDLILKDKERLLSFEEPTRFIFSHSALREGWDNPNVFVICTLKHSDNTISRRQEVGRGLRISVNKEGDRQDDPLTVHDTNVLTVVANESYKDFVAGLQKDIVDSLSERPRVANETYFTGKQIDTAQGPLTIDPNMARLISFYLIQNGYVDMGFYITDQYVQASDNGTLVDLPDQLKPHKDEIHKLINSVYTNAALPQIINGRTPKTNPLNDNFKKKEFKELWGRINKKAVYSVKFDSDELIKKCISALDKECRVTPLQYVVQRGEQLSELDAENLKSGGAFKLSETKTQDEKKSTHSAVKYDLVGKLCEGVTLTRRTVVEILTGINNSVFDQFKQNPENFISEVIRIVNEQKATMIIQHLSYDTIADTFDTLIFTNNQLNQNLSKAGDKLNKHIHDYAVTDSKVERTFVENLDTSAEVVVYAKLPGGFFIPTPVGNYNPDWAIAFEQDSIKHVYFVAETKGSMSSMDLKQIEKTKIECARKFFKRVNTDVKSKPVKYDVVDSYSSLMNLVNN
jgi:type III restriction enzyme